MLGRRQIREKVVQTLYSYQQNPIKVDVLEKNMFADIQKIYKLYVYELNFLLALKNLAEHQIEIGKKKYLKSEQEENPNLKFVNNPILQKIEENNERAEFTSKNSDIVWDLHDDLLVRTFQKMVSGKRYTDYMQSSMESFEEDQKFIGKIFLKYVAENEILHDRIEDKEISWSSDLHIANSMVQKTIGAFKENETPHTLIRMIKNDDDKRFATKLLVESINHWEDTEKKLEERLQNWDIDRVSLLDKIILVAALSELDYFPQTPSRVIINEYIEVSKAFSTDKSHVFVNGILDKYVKDLSRV